MFTCSKNGGVFFGMEFRPRDGVKTADGGSVGKGAYNGRPVVIRPVSKEDFYLFHVLALS